MAKSFKKFRQQWEDDEWGDYEDDDFRGKERRMKKRREKRKDKFVEKYSTLDDTNLED